MVTSLNNTTPARDFGYGGGTQCIAVRHTLTGADAPVTKIGTIPAGSLILGISSRVATIIAGGTPVLGIGSVTAGGAVPAVGGTGNVQTVLAEAAGSELVMPLAAFALPLANDTDFYVGTSGAATSGDVYVVILVHQAGGMTL